MILIVEDERHYLDAFLDELRFLRIDYEVCVSIRAASEFLRSPENRARIRLVVLDVMMDSYDDILPGVDTAGGTRTGFFFLEKVLEFIPPERVVLLTNYGRRAAAEDVRRSAKGVRYYFKSEIDSVDGYSRLLREAGYRLAESAAGDGEFESSELSRES